MFSITDKIRFIENIFGKGKLAANSRNFSVRCPICSPTDKTKFKLAIKIDNDMNHCWTCGWKAHNLALLISKFGTQSELIQYRELFVPDLDKEYLNRLSLDEIAKPTQVKLPDDFRLLSLSSSILPNVKAPLEYLRKRGVTRNDVLYYKLGISNEKRWRRRIIMPSFDENGIINYFVARNYDLDDRRSKYDNPDSNKNDIIFNQINIDWTKRLVICEGPFDLMKCGDNVACLLGSDISLSSKLFSEIAINQTPISLALDSDMWSTKIPKIVKKLQSFNIDVNVVDLREFGDPGSMTKQQFKNALHNAVKPSWESSFLNRLNFVSQTSMSFSNEQHY